MAGSAASAAIVDETYRPRRQAYRQQLAGRHGKLGLCRWGPPDDEPILLLHGWLDNAAAWQLLADCLPDDWPLAALDWAGYGDSDSNPGGYWLPDYLADLEQVLEQLLPGRPARIIGHSLGGTVAAMYAGLRPQRLRWLVNIEGFGLPQLPPAELPARIVQWLDSLRDTGAPKRYGSLEEPAAALRARNPHLPAAHARFLVEAWTRPVAGGYEMLADEAHRQRSPMRYTREEMEACWTRITAPLLLIHAGDSGYLNRIGGERALQRWRELVPALQVAAVDQAGHMLHHEQPAQTAAHIRRFAADR